MTKQQKQDNQRKITPLPYAALLLAWLVPGAGHLYLGRVARGIVIFAVISALFWTGVGIGGVLTVDYYHERWWFAAEMLAGVHGLVSWYRQKNVYDRLRLVPGDTVDEKLKNEAVALVAPAESVARAYAGVAGLLNLLCMFDALLLSVIGVTGERAGRDEAAEQEAAA
jgi:TM2 domain-containing membrane protein YozV